MNHNSATYSQNSQTKVLLFLKASRSRHRADKSAKTMTKAWKENNIRKKATTTPRFGYR